MQDFFFVLVWPHNQNVRPRVNTDFASILKLKEWSELFTRGSLVSQVKFAKLNYSN